MAPVEEVHKIDIGRLIVVPIFAFLMILNFLVVSRDLKTLSPINTLKLFLLIHHLLSLCFYVLIIFLYFIRISATSTSRSHATNFVAIVASSIPFALPFLGTPPLMAQGLLLVANFIITFGMAVSIYSIFWLGRSFSIIPQARKLVQSGPYRLVRHPVYLGELISVFGIVLGGFTVPRLTLYFALIGCQVYRALQEEKLLSRAFPEYKEYCLRTARFIPLLF